MRAFVAADVRDAELFIVGPLRYVDAVTRSYLEELYTLASTSPRVHIIEYLC